MSTQILKALLDIQRQNLILAKLNPQTADSIDDSLAHAYHARLCPVFHTDDAESDPFNDAWTTPRSFVEEVLTHCDDQWQQKKPVAFRDLETKFGTRANRHKLAAVLRYAFLCKRFDDKFFADLLEMAPVEVKHLNRPFDASSLSFAR